MTTLSAAIVPLLLLFESAVAAVAAGPLCALSAEGLGDGEGDGEAEGEGWKAGSRVLLNRDSESLGLLRKGQDSDDENKTTAIIYQQGRVVLFSSPDLRPLLPVDELLFAVGASGRLSVAGWLSIAIHPRLKDNG